MRLAWRGSEARLVLLATCEQVVARLHRPQGDGGLHEARGADRRQGLVAQAQPRRRPVGFSPAGAWALAAMPAFGVSTMNGMETTSHALLFLLAVLWSAQAATRPGRWTGVALGAVLLAGCLSRPEGPMILAAPAAARVVATPRGRRALLLGVGIAGAGFIAFIVHRFSTFGALMPNTVTAKVGGSPLASLWAGIVCTFAFFGGTPALMAGLAVVMVARLARRVGKPDRWSPRDRALALAAGALIALQVLFVLGVGGDWMPGWRFWVPVLPLLALLAGKIMDGFPFFVRFVLVGYLVLGSPFEASPETIQGYRTLEWGRVQSRGDLLVEPLFRAGRELRVIVPEDATIALTEVGVIPCEARRDSLDVFGLTDAEIARVGGGLHESFDGALVLRRAPEFMLLVQRHDEGVFPPDRDLLARPEFHEQHEEERRWPRSLPVPASVGSLEAWMVLYRRKDL